MRTARLKLEGGTGIYHLVTRINNGSRLLGDREKEVLRKQMWLTADFCGVEILTYCLMSNHFHVLAAEPATTDLDKIADEELVRRVRVLYGNAQAQLIAEGLGNESKQFAAETRAALLKRMGSVSRFMQILKQRFSIWFNKTHRRFGTLWAERFKSVIVDSATEALTVMAAYIDLNPVRAGIVSDPKEYRWSGYGEAVAGRDRARSGLLRVLNEGQGKAVNWRKGARNYRVLLYGIGERANGKATIEREEVRRVLIEGGSLPISQMLRCRVRYFTDGAVLGTRPFVEGVFKQKQSCFGAKRKTGPRRMQGNWGPLHVLRSLRLEVFA